MISHIDHLVLTVEDIQKTLDFYTNILGMKEVTFGEHRKALQFGNQKINLHQVGSEIQPHANVPKPGSSDLCFISDISTQQFIEHLKKHNIDIIDGPVKRTGAVSNLESIYFRDPDQNLIEVSNQLKASNVYSTPEPWSLVSNGYEQTTMRFLSQYSKSAIQLSNINPNSNVLDMACGPGTLSRLLDDKVKSITALDFSSKMINLFDNYIQTKQLKNIKTVLGDGQNLFFEDNSFDTIFSMFGLMFFPNRLKGFTECFRVLKPKGQIIVSSWAPVDQSPAMQLMFGAMKAAKPDLPKPEKDMRSLESEKIFKKELEYAGFSNISIHLITHHIELESPKSFWNEMTKGSAPIAMLRKNVDDKTWLSMEKIALDYIKNSISNFPTTLSSDAWIGVADKETSI